MHLILFDLDGTLLDTAPDLGAALNQQRSEHKLPPLPTEQIRPLVSHGSPALLKLGFGIEPQDSRYAGMRVRLLEIYRERLTRETQFFSGAETVLSTLEQRNLSWGIVTNKPTALTEPLVAAFGLRARAACVVSGDSTPRRKPHPDQLLRACALANRAPSQAVYVGDAERDVQAAHSAGMLALVALYGYIGASEQPEHWQADGLLPKPAALLEWIDHHGAAASALKGTEP